MECLLGKGTSMLRCSHPNRPTLLLPDISEPPLSSSGSLCATSSSCTLMVEEHCDHQCDIRGFWEIVPSMSE
jgi:hypothetical protein